MCLGVPGKLLSIQPDPLGMTMGRVSFAGIVKDVCLAYTPEAEPGDFVVVHVGFSIARIDEDEAAKVFAYLREMGDLDGIDLPQPGDLADGSVPERPPDPAGRRASRPPEPEP
jgi:hydrogenase expression/formation protein HypC